MLIRAVLPAVRSRPHIARYWYLMGCFDQPAPIRLLPDGGVHLLFNFGEGARSEHYGDSARAKGVYLVGANSARGTATNRT